jgi:DNA mismatch repair protein MutS2
VKYAALLDAPAARVLGFEWLSNAVAPVSPYGERIFAELAPFTPGEETKAKARAAVIATVAAAVDFDCIGAVRAALREMPDAAPAVARASMGDTLDDAGFLELWRFCSTLERVDELLSDFADHSRIANPASRAVAAALAPGARGEFGFYLADAFDADLRSAREALAREQAQLDASRGRESERIARELGRDAIESEEFILMRADLRGSLPGGVRVVREAPTYLLCSVEYGDASLAALERRDAAARALAAAEARVRLRLSAVAREHAAGLDSASAALGALDVLLGAAAFAQRHRCTPAVTATEPMISFEQARFLPLEDELAVAGRRFVPLDLELHDAVVLTGPNMGGKSVSLQTCGFVALCAAFGLPVPASRASCALFDQIAWLGLGRDAEIGGLLSSFAREVLELKAVFERESPRLLMLADEFARTTTPHEGKALLVAFLERLRGRGACGMLATHLGGIADAAGVRHYAVRGLRGIPRQPPTRDVAEALSALAEAMDYTVGEVSGDEAAHADAIALTALLGLDSDFVDAAYRALVE